jgi:hypothetical protein
MTHALDRRPLLHPAPQTQPRYCEKGCYISVALVGLTGIIYTVAMGIINKSLDTFGWLTLGTSVLLTGTGVFGFWKSRSVAPINHDVEEGAHHAVYYSSQKTDQTVHLLWRQLLGVVRDLDRIVEPYAEQLPPAPRRAVLLGGEESPVHVPEIELGSISEPSIQQLGALVESKFERLRQVLALCQINQHRLNRDLEGAQQEVDRLAGEIETLKDALQQFTDSGESQATPGALKAALEKLSTFDARRVSGGVGFRTPTEGSTPSSRFSSPGQLDRSRQVDASPISARLGTSVNDDSADPTGLK